MSGRRLAPMDAMWIYGESPETMMHVGILLTFTKAPDSRPDTIAGIIEQIRTSAIYPPWTLRLQTPRFPLNPIHHWVKDDGFDIDYHVRHSALPHPGGERELGVLVSRLHSNPLDLSRPLWEIQFIEGLDGDRFALFLRFHHSLVDGYTANQLLLRSLSPDPGSRAERLFVNVPEPERPQPHSGGIVDVGALLGRAASVTKSVPDLMSSLIKLELRRDGDFKNLISSHEAPMSALNPRVGRHRRLASQQLELARVRAVAKAAGGKLNDVVLAVCGGGLRRFLLEQGRLEDKPLIAFVPVNVRPKGDTGGGNAVGAILVTLATDVADPVQRLRTIIRSSTQAKAQLVDLPMESVLAYSAVLMAPSGTQLLASLTGVKNPIPLTFNLCVSNVPGPTRPLYFQGHRLEANYPLSIVAHSMALNITCMSYAGMLNFGFVGDRDALPHLQRLALHAAAELDALEVALGLGIPDPAPPPQSLG